MPALQRNFFGGYYSASPDNPRIFHGIEVYHAVDCGRFMDNGIEKCLMHYTLCKDDLPDTRGRNVEMCDFSLLDSDLDNQPIMVALMTDPQAALALVAPCVAELLMQDFVNGLSPFEIAELRAGVLVPEFLGFTLAQVLYNRPDIYQPMFETLDPPQERTTYDENGNATTILVTTLEIPNVTPCSLEVE